MPAVRLLRMTDEAGPDSKILAVPIDNLCSLYRQMQKPEDMPPLLLAQIAHFFEHYKDLEPSKWVKVEGWENSPAAKTEIISGVERYKNAKDKPYF